MLLSSALGFLNPSAFPSVEATKITRFLIKTENLTPVVCNLQIVFENTTKKSSSTKRKLDIYIQFIFSYPCQTALRAQQGLSFCLVLKFEQLMAWWILLLELLLQESLEDLVVPLTGVTLPTSTRHHDCTQILFLKICKHA